MHPNFLFSMRKKHAKYKAKQETCCRVKRTDGYSLLVMKDFLLSPVRG